MTKILAVVPARSGAKSVTNKNIRDLAGKPLLAYSIESALNTSLINRVILATDSAEYAEIGKKFGAEIPFLRPDEISGDLSTDYELFSFILGFLKESENYVPEIVVQLRPTYPFRKAADIDKMIELLINNPEVDSVRSVTLSEVTPYKMWQMDKQGFLRPVIKQEGIESYNMPRQALPMVYIQNAAIDVTRYSTIMEGGMSGKKILGYVMEHNFDIDTEDDFNIANKLALIQQGKATFVVDVDGVIAKLTNDLNYELSQPCFEIINIINKLYDLGNKIILYTARGSLSGLDWREVTRKQINSWNVKHHELKFGKPASDFYLDDKSLTLSGFYKLNSLLGKI